MAKKRGRVTLMAQVYLDTVMANRHEGIGFISESTCLVRFNEYCDIADNNNKSYAAFKYIGPI
ncbi:hypothetical protein V1477_012530 [Vespula maculifrons]|uniref:Uncharacterized protein n=1 Tax=Vespula maculifrons TaxID=7453 RepID=A0ABD2BXR4_VESMC